MRKILTPAWLMAIFLLSLPVALYAQDYSLDSSFGINGKVWDPEGPYGPGFSYYQKAPRELMMEDGKILHISTTSLGTMITRYLQNGTIDSTFGNGVPGIYPGTFGNGTVRYTYTASPLLSLQSVADAALLPGGKFVVAGTVTRNDIRMYGLVRYLPDGTPDLSFGQSGIVVTQPGSGNADPAAMALQTDGKLVVSGTAVEEGIKVFATARYHPDGTLDNSFDADGISYTFYGERDATAAAVALQMDGKIVVAGDVQNVVYHDRFGYPTGPQYLNDAGLVRLNSDGSMDASFGTNGRATLQTFDETEHVRCMAIQPDGKIVFAGDLQYYFTIFFTMRFTTEGVPDTSFGTTGKQQFNFGFDGGFSQDIGIMEDGTILYTLNDASTGPQQDIQLFRVPPGGTLGYVRSYSYQERDGNGVLVSTDVGGFMAQQGSRIIIGGLSTYRPAGMSTPLTKAFLVRVNSSARLISRNPVKYYRDGDGDGYGNRDVSTVSYTVPQGYVLTDGDCNDADAAVHPGAAEVSDGKDNDCNGSVDDLITYTLIPAKIEAEAYASQNGTQLEPTLDAGGGQNVGWIDYGDWMDYPISVPSAGVYSVSVRLATPSTSHPQFVMREGETVLAVVDVPNTGGFQSWQTLVLPIPLQQGNQTLRIVSTGGGYWNVNWLQFSKGYNPITYVHLPAKIEAETYTTQYGTQQEATADAGGGQNVGWIDAGDWLDYAVHSTGGAYTLDVRVASQMGGGQFDVRRADGTILATFSVPYTGSWQTWTTLTTTFLLPPGDQVLRLVSTTPANWNINWLEFRTDTTHPGDYVQIPAKIEAEAYANQSGTQVEATTDEGGGVNVGYIDWGDWMEYKVSVPVTGTYWVGFRIATPSVSHPQFVLKTGDRVLAVVDVPNTGGFQQWQTLSLPIPLEQGNQVIRIVSTGGGYWNINWMEFYYYASITKAPGIQDKGGSNPATLLNGTNVYPNPVRSALTLEVNNADTGPLNADIVDGSGRVVKHFTLNKQGSGLRTTLSLYGLPQGAYFIRVAMQGQWVSKKVVKDSLPEFLRQ